MIKHKGKAEVIDIDGLLAQDADFVRAALEALAQGPTGPVLDRAVRTLSALGEGVGRHPCGKPLARSGPPTDDLCVMPGWAAGPDAGQTLAVEGRSVAMLAAPRE
jgi:hypothetical protein